jgi:hypothetical protein
MSYYESMTVTDLTKILTCGALKAIRKITGEWQTASEGRFTSSGAEFLHWQYKNSQGQPMLCEKQQGSKYAKKIGWINAYRLTPLGLQVQRVAREMEEN